MRQDRQTDIQKCHHFTTYGNTTTSTTSVTTLLLLTGSTADGPLLFCTMFIVFLCLYKFLGQVFENHEGYIYQNSGEYTKGQCAEMVLLWQRSP